MPKALIARDSQVRSPALNRAEAVMIRRVGARVVTTLRHGTLIDASPKQLEALEKAGFRVTAYAGTDALRVGAFEITAAHGAPQLPANLRVPDPERAKWRHHLVMLAGPPEREWTEELEARGLEVVARVSPYAVFVIGDAKLVEGLDALDFVEWAGPFEPGYRLDARLAKLEGEVPVRVGVYPPDHADEIRDRIAHLGGKIEDVILPPVGYHGEPAWIRATLAVDRLDDIARAPDVTRIEHAPPKEWFGERETQILNEAISGAGVPLVGYVPALTNLGVNGTGVTVAICDSGIDTGANMNTTGHLDLRGRQAAFVDYTGGVNAADPVGHGTHVAGIALGNAATGLTEGAAPNNFAWGQGMAPAAQYVNQQMGGAPLQPAGGYQVLTTNAVTNGATIQNNSWGAPSQGYDADCRTYDQLVRDPDPNTARIDLLTIVFAAGNDGGFPTTIGNPAEAKNVITVGNSLTVRPGVGVVTENVAGLNGNSARGPTPDGRLKPEIVAPGTDVSSTYAPSGFLGTLIAGVGTPDPANPGALINRYSYMSGTSMAAPHVTGTCALLSEWWRGRTGADPSPAMLKALLVNGAEDIAGGPNLKEVTGGRFANVGGQVYACAGLGYTPAAVWDQQAALAQVANQAAITANGQWAYNAATDTLFVRRTTGGAPGQRSIWARDGAPIAAIPNNDQGWGRVSLPNMMLQTPASDRGPKLFSDQAHAFTASGQEAEYRISPVDGARPLRITLAWTDAPGNVGAAANPALVNNLNLQVHELATGNIYRGNVFANGMSTAGGVADTLNNLECVYIQNPAGVYRVRVRAATVTANALPPYDNTPYQDFALVADNGAWAEADPVNVALVLDRSSSMSIFGYVDATRTSSKQFVDLMGVDDRLGVVSFGSTASVDYQDAGKAKAITGAPDQAAARTAIDNVNFGGCTYMGDGLSQGAGLLAGLAGESAVVLLSDGYDNKGCDESNPAKQYAVDVAAGLPAALSVYTCAMGPTADQQTLEDIADATGGRYFYMPTIDDLYEIYNYIRGNVTDDGVIANASAFASRSRVAGIVDCKAERVIFTAVWGDPSLHYVNRDPKKASEIAVRLRDPRGRLLPADCGYVRRTVGQGYVVFHIDEPLAGRWFVEVETAREQHTRYTVGGFVRSDLRIDLASTVHTVVGRPVRVNVRAALGKRAIDRLQVRATLVAPRIDPDALIAKLGRELDQVKPIAELLKDGMPKRLAQLVALRTKLLRDGKDDLFAHTTTRLRVQPIRAGSLRERRLREIKPTLENLRGAESLATSVSGRFARLSQPAVVSPATISPTMVRTLDPRIVRRPPLVDIASKLALPGMYTTLVPRVSASHNVMLTIAGQLPGSRCRFMRYELLSFVAGKPG